MLEAIDRAVAGCKIVFHLAYDRFSPRSNITGAHNLLEACRRHGSNGWYTSVQMAVYEPLPSDPVDVTEEFQPPAPSFDLWGYKARDRRRHSSISDEIKACL